MTISFENALGIHPQALALREKRAEVLASNLANSETPNYKARDFDFQSILKKEMNVVSKGLERTHQAHFQSEKNLLGGQVAYRIPNQASLDGNTVEDHIEQAKYSENAVQYQASLTFLNGKLSGLMAAIRGE